MSADDDAPTAHTSEVRTEQMLAKAAAYASGFVPPSASRSPKVAVLTCMDARIDPAALLGLQPGDAHVIRNAGGVASDDAIRSLAISQRLLGTEEIVLIHHSDCGMEKVDEEGFRSAVYAETGVWPNFALDAFPDAASDVRRTAERLRRSPFVSSRALQGFLYEVETGRLRPIPLD